MAWASSRQNVLPGLKLLNICRCTQAPNGMLSFHTSSSNPNLSINAETNSSPMLNDMIRSMGDHDRLHEQFCFEAKHGRSQVTDLGHRSLLNPYLHTLCDNPAFLFMQNLSSFFKKLFSSHTCYISFPGIIVCCVVLHCSISILSLGTYHVWEC